MNQDPLHNDEKLEQADRIAYLVAGHLSNSLTEEEQEELDAWIVESDENLELFEKLTDEDNIELALQAHRRKEEEKRTAFDLIRKKIGDGRPDWFRRFGPLLVAASLLAVAAISYLLVSQNTPAKIENTVAATGRKKTIEPGSNKAVLTLSDGRTLILEPGVRGVVAEDKGAKVMAPSSGTLAYQAGAHNGGEHTLSTPRGGQYQLVLADGTAVWLNAASSLRFPLAFSGSERRVQLTGEAYFEVAKDKDHPFYVDVSMPEGLKGEVKVLGTHFNINAYGDEPLIKATLLEGQVEVRIAASSRLLKPGEQALISNNINIRKVNAGEEIAWKNGMFLFRNATIRSIGEQIKRWYDVEVVYKGSIDQHFNTELSRQVPLSRLLNVLEKTQQVHFELQDRTVVIKP